MKKSVRLYKYFRFNDNFILNLMNDGIYVSTRSQLNDPFDSLFGSKIDGRKTEYKGLIKLINTVYPDIFGDLAFNNENLFTVIKENDINLEQLIILNQFKIDPTNFYIYISQKLRIISFSKKKHSNVLWAHYSDEYKGIMIEYIVKPITNRFEQLIEVNYKSKPRQLKIGDNISLFVFGYKSKDGSYEAEKRIVVDLEGGVKYYTNIEIKKIYFGYKFDENKFDDLDHLSEFLNFCKNRKDIDFYTSRINEELQRIEYLQHDIDYIIQKFKIDENTL